MNLERFLEADVAARAAGIELVSAGEGEVRVAMTVRADHANPVGTTHGGVLFLFADTAFGLACNAGGRVTVARTCTIEYLAPAHIGDRLEAHAVERLRAGRGGIYDVSVLRPSDGARIAEFRGHSREIRST